MSNNKDKKGKVYVVSSTYSEYQHDGRTEDRGGCVSCNSGENGVANRCLSCIKTIKLSDGKVFSDEHANLRADVYMAEKNGGL